jgi:hypothetical protein
LNILLLILLFLKFCNTASCASCDWSDNLLRNLCTHRSNVISTKQWARILGICGHVLTSAAWTTSTYSSSVGFYEYINIYIYNDRSDNKDDTDDDSHQSHDNDNDDDDYYYGDGSDYY